MEFSQDRANVQSIEIYKPERAYYEGDISGFLKTNEPLAVLDSEHYTNFLDTLCTLDFEKEVVFLPIPMDGGYDYEGYIIAISEYRNRTRQQPLSGFSVQTAARGI